MAEACSERAYYHTFTDGGETDAATALYEARLEPSSRTIGDVVALDRQALPKIVSGLLAASPAQLVTKRAIDVLISTIGLIVGSPVLIIAALAVRFTSAGPVLYVDSRMGRDGQPFRMYKFRSMYRDAAQRRNALVISNEVSGPVFKIRSDPRITPVGRLIRKLSIDELPQLWNVVRGHMSLVGPRPPLPAEYETYSEQQRRRLDVRPGITCIWQVSGRSNIPFDQWIAMDLDYIEQWNVRLDLKLLLRTIPAVLTGRGAY